MNNIWPIALITYKEGLRQRVLYGVIIASLFIIVLSVMVSGLFMRDLLKIILDICLSSVAFGGLLVPFFLAINLFSGDIDKKTIFTILAKPVSRDQYILGKFLGFSLLTGTIIAVLTVAALLAVYGASFIYHERHFISFSLPPIIVSSWFAYVGVLVLTSTVLLWCTVTTSSFLATLLVLCTYVIGQTIESIVHFISLKLEEVEISPIVQTVVHAVQYIFPNLAAFDLKQLAAYGLPIPLNEIVFLCLYGMSYISVMLILTIFFFKRRDLA